MNRLRYVFPLYGARCALRDAGLFQDGPDDWPARASRLGGIAQGVECILPSLSDWRFLQPSEATEMDDVWDLDDHLPWPGVVVTSPALPGPGAGVDAAARSRHAAALAEDVVRALHLYKTGWFLNPALTESIEDDGRGQLRRAMGAYRMLYHDEDTHGSRPPPADCLALDAADFEPASPFHGMFTMLRDHRRAPVASAEMALDAFGRTFGVKLTPSHRLTLLFIAMETMFGRRDERREAGTFAQRLGTALALGGMQDGPASATWYEAESRALRNAVAHGRPLAGADADAATDRITDIVRRCLPAYVAFSCQWRRNDGAEGQADPRDTSCTAMFNSWLAHSSGANPAK